MDKKQLQNNILEAEYNRAVWFDVLKDYFGVKKLFLEPKNITVDKSKAEYAVELGSFTTADEREVGIFEVKLQPQVWIERNRVGLRSLLRQVYKYDVDGALIVFQQDQKWRFSYVSEIRTEDGKKETEPKRYTYLFGKGESCRTAAERFDKLKGKPIHLNDLYDAFSVEKLNKDFFKTYKEFNEKFWKYLAEPKNGYRKLFIDKKYEEVEKQEKPIRDFTKKLLGRIVFLHFLQKKGWMGVPVTIHEWKDGEARFMQNLFANCKDKVTFHSKVLKTLFFKTLNTKRDNDLAHASLGKNIRIPYLNGGLFDKDISFDNEIDFPVEYFSGLLDFFEQYNFTIDENDPYDSEVGIDPEMLGHIFENLLEENREKGAFYTPKEIVHYMCQESLLQYLRTHLPECTEDDSPATIALQNFIRKGETGDRTDRKNFVVQQAKRIEKLLDSVKVCDPAIGSGAFPMGMLQEIYKAKTALDLTLDRTEVKKRIIQDSIYGVDIENGAVEIARLRFWLALVVDETEPQPLPNLDYKIMQGNSLLESFEGVDLSSLGSFDRTKEEQILFAQRGQYEIGAAFSKTKQSLLVFDQKSKAELYELIDDYFSYDETTNTKYKSKQFIKDEINRIVEGKLITKFYLEKPKIEKQIDEVKSNLKIARELPTDNTAIKQKKEKTREKLTRQLSALEDQLEGLNNIIDQLHNLQTRTDKPYFLWHLWFKEVFDKGGFDIVIGNPPYIEFKKLPSKEKELYKNYQTASRKYDLYVLFIELSNQILKEKGCHCFINPTTFLMKDYGIPLREFIKTKFRIKEIIDFADYQIFESAITYTGIFSFVKRNKEDEKYNFIYQKFSKPNEPIKDKRQLFEIGRELSFKSIQQVASNKLIADSWIFNNALDTNLFSKIENVKFPLLKDITKYIFVGIQSGKDEVFFVDKETIKENSLEKEIVIPIYKGKDIRKYEANWGGTYIIYPYRKEDTAPIDEKTLKNKYPNVYRYLVENKNKLKGRDYFDNSGKAWYELWCERIFSKFSQKKIINCEISPENRFHLDEDKFLGNTKVFSTVLNDEFKENYLCLLAILNSKLMNYYHKKIASPKAGGFYDYKTQFIEKYPINFPKDVSQFNKLVLRIIELKKEKLPTAKYENKIEAMVFKLYDLTEEEMLQILDTFSDLSIKDRNQIQNEYWNIANNKFKIEA
jgi:adenine-specific DNA-methyltransferase